MNLKKETLVPLCKAIGENSSLMSLDFAGNFKHGTLTGKVKPWREIEKKRGEIETKWVENLTQYHCQLLDPSFNNM